MTAGVDWSRRLAMNTARICAKSAVPSNMGVSWRATSMVDPQLDQAIAQVDSGSKTMTRSICSRTASPTLTSPPEPTPKR